MSQQKPLLLVFDIGNTRVKCCAYGTSPNRLIKQCHAPTLAIAKLVQSLLKEFTCVQALAVCSVVPQATEHLRNVSTEHQIRFITAPSLKTCALAGMPISYERPEKLGQDRLASALSAWVDQCRRSKEGTGSPRPVVVVDAGTAVNIEVVDPSHGHLGGAILPGLQMMFTALCKGTAQLPECHAALPSSSIGRSTGECLQSGVVYGFIGAVDGVLQRIVQQITALQQKRLGGEGDVMHARGTEALPKPYVIATGGDGLLLHRLLPLVDVYDENIVLEGARISALLHLQQEKGD